MAVHEITITAKNASGETAIVHAEFTSNGDAPADAAHEVYVASEKEYGKARVKEIDPAR